MTADEQINPEDAPREIMLRAHAKLNLALAVDAPVTNGAHMGYHPIASWMTPIDLADELEVTRLQEDRLSRYAIQWHPKAPQRAQAVDWSVRDDLAVRAHMLLETTIGRTLPVQMKLEKKIPPGSGLGGGSSDAAAMLRAVRELYGLDITDDALRTLGATLGSDVPFFLQGEGTLGPQTAIVEGFGEQVTRCARIDAHFVLVLPTFSCATQQVYHVFDEQFDDADHAHEHGRLVPLTRPFARENVTKMTQSARFCAQNLFNDLSAAAMRVSPELAELAERVEMAVGGKPHVSGSGSSLFLVVSGELGADAKTTSHFDAEVLAHRVQGAAGDIAAVVVVRGV